MPKFHTPETLQACIMEKTNRIVNIYISRHSCLYHSSVSSIYIKNWLGNLSSHGETPSFRITVRVGPTPKTTHIKSLNHVDKILHTSIEVLQATSCSFSAAESFFIIFSFFWPKNGEKSANWFLKTPRNTDKYNKSPEWNWRSSLVHSHIRYAFVFYRKMYQIKRIAFFTFNLMSGSQD